MPSDFPPPPGRPAHRVLRSRRKISILGLAMGAVGLVVVAVFAAGPVLLVLSEEGSIGWPGVVLGLAFAIALLFLAFRSFGSSGGDGSSTPGPDHLDPPFPGMP